MQANPQEWYGQYGFAAVACWIVMRELFSLVKWYAARSERISLTVEPKAETIHFYDDRLKGLETSVDALKSAVSNNQVATARVTAAVETGILRTLDDYGSRLRTLEGRVR